MMNLPAFVSDSAKHTLSENRWFSGLSVKHQLALLAATRRMLLRDGQHFASAEQNVRKRRDGFAVLLDGLLKISSTALNGRESILTYVRPGQWFGELAALDGQTRERDFICVGSAEIGVIEPEAMSDLLQDAELARHMALLMAARTRTLLSMVEDFSTRSSRVRTARRLVMLAHDDEPHAQRHRLRLDVSQDVLASMLGMTRQSVASQLRHLSACGAISQAYGRVNISSMEALMAEAEEA
jgi:CRP/FNR family transcriptional regulator, cyclic AMP receptor protein